MKKSVIIIGATGMVGGLALRLCLENPNIQRVTVIGRRKVGVEHEKLQEVIHDDFLDYSAVSDALKDQDIALFCLGVYTGAVPDDEFKKITVDYTLAFAETLKKQSQDATFCLLSGMGADRTEKSRTSFARYKGMAENGLADMGFKRLHFFRPGYVYPVTPRDEPNIWYRLYRRIYPLISRLFPGASVTSEALALAMVYTGLHNTDVVAGPEIENKDIQTIARQAGGGSK